MRPLLPGDLDMAVRALLAVPEPDRPGLARQLLDEAQVADKTCRRLGRAHPAFGDGSLYEAARRHQRESLPDYCNDSYCAALAVLIEAVMARKSA
ncbi:hypothetical protein EU803_05640 [Loktanella sp. IMCC34160]|uniref:DUF7742 family protein n=1 Tax=Loktanella sp. IMCC34160 TaxID=2510646 RepID=UPI00101C2D4C|nr:hypothetical protein [Loktanella sp. IMCC34160]RYG91933.1 hypothetical protein EU803_05640 [Loktanella sp. IMCC34160]